MIGSRLGKWLLDREIGRGGMGRVYRAHDVEQPEQLAAVKVLAAELTVHAGAVHRFQREIDVLNTLDHANIVRFYESGTHEGLLYYIMEYVEGPDYAELIEEQGRLPWTEVLDVAIQVSAALKHAHDHGVIHRDIKPSNLMRGNNGVIKLTDFGIAHVFAGKHLTRAGAVVGTAEYLSPEQAEGKSATRRSDLYSLGCVLYTLLCGRTPFQGESVLELLHKHRYAQFDLPQKVVPSLPHEIGDVICQLLEKVPDKRPPDAGVLLRRLEALRRKLDRRGDHTVDDLVVEPTQLGDTITGFDDGGEMRGEGPATLMSRLLRKELEAQNRGGPVRQFFNRPAVLVILFILCFGTLVWTLWPDDAEKVYEEGRALMESGNPDNYAAGWEKLKRVKDKFANGPHAEDLERYQKLYEDDQDAREAARRSDHLGEAEWFYMEGLRQRQRGQAKAAKQTWQHLIDAFGDVPAENRWVRLARQELEKPAADANEQRWKRVHEALAQARAASPEEAEKRYQALEALYRGDPSAREMLQAIQGERDKRDRK
jgi:hypothetical protein